MGDSFSGIFKDNLDAAAEFVLFGAPYDAGSSFRPGSRLGPEAIRRMAQSFNSCTERGVDLGHLNARDDDDLALGNRMQAAFQQIEEKVSQVMDQNAVPIVLGGDHSVTIPCIQAALRHHPKLNVLYFDAHPDLYGEYDGDKNSHACVMARALELGVDGKNITMVGVRAANAIQSEVAQKHQIKIVHCADTDQFKYQCNDPVYVSFDIDVLDPAHAPGCGNPVPGGLSFRQALNIIHGIDAPIVGLDIVEVNPLLDYAGITSLAAVRVVVEFLGVMAQRGA